MTTDTPSAEELADKLAAHNRWRRGDDEPAPEPTELGKTIDAAAAMLRSIAPERDALAAANEAFGKRQEWWNERMFTLEQERDALRNDFSALQHALVGNTGASAIQRAASLVAERAEADKIISNLRSALDAAQATREVPRLTEPVIAAAWRLACGPERPTAAMVEAYARDIESRVRELCGVVP